MTNSAPTGEQWGWAAIGADLALLARLHDREVDGGLIATLRSTPVADWFALRIADQDLEKASMLLNQAFALAPEPLTAEALDEMAAEYAAIYLNHTYRVSPYESFWLTEDGLERQEPMFLVRNCFARFGFSAPNWRLRADDHIAHELAFLSQVASKLGDPDTAQIVAQFMREHPLVWIPQFAGRVARRSQSLFYAGVALLTETYLRALSDVLARCHGLDMTLIEPQKSPVLTGGPTCADPSPRYTPGPGPGW